MSEPRDAVQDPVCCALLDRQKLAGDERRLEGLYADVQLFQQRCPEEVLDDALVHANELNDAGLQVALRRSGLTTAARHR